MGADLHLHTTASDGSWTPNELVMSALKLGLSTIAITDHDTIEGIQPALDLEASDLCIIPGIEFSTEYKDQEIHILGYGIDIEHPPLLKLLKRLGHERIIRAKAIIERLQKLGLDIDYQMVMGLSGSGTTGRVHIARILKQQGYITTISEGFSRYLSPNCPAYVKRFKLSPSQAIDEIREAGGAPVLAHPGQSDCDHLIPRLKSAGLAGIEIIHPSHSNAQRKHYLALAKRLGLLTTGGSDCHGPKGKDILYLGTEKIPDRWVCLLKSYLGI